MGRALAFVWAAADDPRAEDRAFAAALSCGPRSSRPWPWGWAAPWALLAFAAVTGCPLPEVAQFGRPCASARECEGAYVCSAGRCTLPDDMTGGGPPDAGGLPADGGIADGGSGTTDGGGGDAGFLTADGGASSDAGGGDPGWDGGTDTEPSCGANEHAEGGSCMPNQRSCFVNNGTGRQTWDVDAWGACELLSCNEAHHEEDGACMANTRSCAVANGSGVETWSGGAWGACIRTTCNSGYHAEGGACVADTRTCAMANGTGVQSWVSDGPASGWSACVVVECIASYHIENNACAPDTQSCPIENGSGTQIWEGSGYGPCSVASCDEAHHEEDGACVSSAGGYITGPLSMQFAVIPRGTFTMGSPPNELGRDSDETQHEVTFTYDFAMGVTEVTQGQWQAKSGGTNPSDFPNCGDNCPVELVDWYSTLAYANALSRDAGLQECYTLTPPDCADEVGDWGGGDTSCTGATFVGLNCTGYRLPTEAEWEYAYRAGTTTAYYSGVNTQTARSPLDPNLDAIGWYGGNSEVLYSGGVDCGGSFPAGATCGTQPVGGKKANAWGLYDMSGNVWEWTWDWYADYPGEVLDYIGPQTGGWRGFRGGSWNSNATRARAAFRHVDFPFGRRRDIGFRLTRTLPTCENDTRDGGDGVCVAAGSCSANFHDEDGTCVFNTQSCPIENGSGTQTWEGSGYGPCSFESCNSGYHDGGNGTCVTTGTCASSYELNGDGACVRAAGGYVEGPLNMQFAVIPKGTFTMGSPTNELGRNEDETQHEVTFTYDFAMGVTEVTQGQWQAKSGGANPSYFSNCGDNCPVENVDWYSTLAYANALSRDAGLQECYTLTPIECADEVSDWGGGDTSCTGATFVGLSCMGYRLPTEAEWEYAYRAGTTTAYHSGINTQTVWSPLDPNLDEIGWYGGNSGVTYSGGWDCSGWFTGAPSTCGTQPVGGKQANAWGIYDMSGNVWEWTWDWYGTYPGTIADYIGPQTGSVRVLRGGSWYNYALFARAADRINDHGPDYRSSHYGFRLTRTLP